MYWNCRAKAGICAKLAAAGIDPGTIPGLDEVFEDVTHPFCGLETGFKQEKYFRDILGLLVRIKNDVCELLANFVTSLGTRRNTDRRS